ncbi:MAG: LPS assembly lipoprotein LptE [Magnetovibrio sp.]|nr:LPS assembly lipoprotein LptE [Magnetovibrio sp.]
MWSFRPVWIFGGLLVLAGCGFQPLHGKFSAAGNAAEFPFIEIGTIEDRTGQQLKSELLRRLHAQGRAGIYRYRLHTELRDSTSSLAVQKGALATRADLRMSANFRLERISDRQALMSATERVTVSYNIFDSEFSTLMAEKNARQRAVRSLSDEIVNRLAVFFRSGGKLGGERDRETRRQGN